MAFENRMSQTRKEKDTLCWNCANAVPDLKGRGCDWSRNLEPVPGWEAKKTGRVETTHKNGKTRQIKTTCFCVISCPKFIKD